MSTRIVCTFAMLQLSLGCSADIEPEKAGTAGGPSISTKAEALETCSCNNSSYSQYIVPDVSSGPSTATHICWPTQYDGSTGASPYLFASPDYSSWTFQGDGKIECVPQCCFYSNGGDEDVRWLSGSFLANAYSSGGSGIAYDETALWQGDAMSIMSGAYHSRATMRGDYLDSAAVHNNNDPFEPSRVAVTATQTSQTFAEAYSFFVGTPYSGHDVKGSHYEQVGIGTQNLISASSGICTLSAISGARETAVPRVYRANGTWRLQIQGSYQDATAQAQCFRFNQSQ